MKKILKIPCLPGWVAAVVIGLWGLSPTYAFVRAVPVVIGVLIACFCLLLLLRRRHRRAGNILLIGFTALVFLGLVLGCATGGMILNAAQGDEDTSCDYIIVLGAQVNPSGPSVSLQERIDAAYDYLIDHPDTIAIVTGGKGDDEHMSEGDCMFQTLTAMGIPAHRVWVENQASSTWGNLIYSLDIIEARTGSRPARVGVVSSEYHLFRTGLQARDLDLEIQGIPAKTGGFHRFLHYFLREIAGVWHYILLGGQYQ